MMKANPSPTSVADYCEGMEAGRIVVNHDYQREEGIWGAFARSYFIESIILGYPIPKIFLYTRFDLKSRRSIKEIEGEEEVEKTEIDDSEDEGNGTEVERLSKDDINL